MENTGLAILAEKDHYWLEKDFGGKHGSKNAEPRKEGGEVNPVSRDAALRAQLPSADAGNGEIDLAHQGWRAEGTEPGVTRRSI